MSRPQGEAGPGFDTPDPAPEANAAPESVQTAPETEQAAPEANAAPETEQAAPEASAASETVSGAGMDEDAAEDVQPDWKKMYLTLAGRVENAIETAEAAIRILTDAQRACEDLYVTAGEERAES